MRTNTTLARTLAVLGLSALAAGACSDATSPIAPVVPRAPSLAKGGPNTLPMNGRIYFVSSFTGNAEVYSVNPDGSGRRRLTYTAERENDIAVSLDGKKLVVVASVADDKKDIYTMNVDGSNRRRVTTQNDATLREASWSPDGRTIVFVQAAPGEAISSIWTVSPSGSGMKRVSAPGVGARGPVWSPDGTRILYMSYVEGVAQVNLSIMNADGSNAQLLRECAAGLPCLWPAWSPDGRRIVYSQGFALDFCVLDQPSGPFCGVYGGGTVPGERAVYSPDGSRLVIGESPTVAGQRLFTADANGAALTAITDNVFALGGFAWGR